MPLSIPPPNKVEAREAFRSVPAEVREELKAQLLSTNVLTYGDLTNLAKFITAHIVSGEISIAQADCIRKYMEYMLASLTLDVQDRKRTKEGDEDNDMGLPAAVLKRLTSAQRNAETIAKRTITVKVDP